MARNWHLLSPSNARLRPRTLGLPCVRRLIRGLGKRRWANQSVRVPVGKGGMHRLQDGEQSLAPVPQLREVDRSGSVSGSAGGLVPHLVRDDERIPQQRAQVHHKRVRQGQSVGGWLRLRRRHRLRRRRWCCWSRRLSRAALSLADSVPAVSCLGRTVIFAVPVPLAACLPNRGFAEVLVAGTRRGGGPAWGLCGAVSHAPRVLSGPGQARRQVCHTSYI